MNNSVFLVDSGAIKKYGISQWQENFFWPVSDNDFVSLCKDIEDCFARYINSESAEISDILLVQRNLMIECWHFLHALLVTNRIRDKRKKIIISPGILWYKDILSESFSPKPLYSAKKITYHRSTNIPPLRRFKQHARRIGDFLMEADIVKMLRGIITNNDFVYCGKNSLMREYIKQLPHCAYPLSSNVLIPNDIVYDLPDSFNERIDSVSASIARELKAIADKNNIRTIDVHIDYLQHLIENELRNAAQGLLYIQRTLRSSRKRRILIVGVGNVLYRMLSIVARQLGMMVTTFAHGGCVGLYDTPSFRFSEFSISDKFITYTDNSIELYSKIKEKHFPLRNNRVSFSSANSSQFQTLFRRFSRYSRPKKLKKIMFIGYPHNQWRKHQGPVALSVIQLDFELRVIRQLRNAGYTVLYKVHPERVQEAEGFFENMVTGHVQDNINMADAFIFGSIRTTAFTIALCTNKPIVAFRIFPEPYSPFPKAFNLLEKRCQFINAYCDERNRIMFDENELLDELNRKLSVPNNEFIETYMFPKKN